MPFVRLPGLKGKVYVPETDAGFPRKHPCRDCFSCQICSDDRCSLCLKQKSACRKVACPPAAAVAPTAPSCRR